MYMIKYKRTILACLGILFIFIGSIGGFYWREIYDYSTAGTINRNSIVATAEQSIQHSKQTPIVQAVKQVEPAVVGITTRVYNQDPFDGAVSIREGVGSGIIFSQDGYIVTNAHVVGRARKVMVSLSDGKTYEGRVVGKDTLTDLAVVKIKAKHLPVATLGDSDALQVGETAIAIGNPLGLEFQGTVTTGVISSVHRTVGTLGETFQLIQTDAAINPGNSGGALVDVTGKVIGINSAKIAKEGIEGLGFAIPINGARPIIQALIKTGRVQRPYLGFIGVDYEMATRGGLQLPIKGILVYRTIAHSPLADRDIQVGDIMTAIDDQRVDKMSQVQQILQKHHIGERVKITVYREGTYLSMLVQLAEMPIQE